MSQLEPGSPKQETDPGGRRCWWTIDGKAPRGIERGIPWVGWILFVVIVAIWNAWPEPMPRLPVIDLENAYPDVADSIREASKAAREQPRSGKAWGRLGMILMACGYGTDSIVVFAEAERLDPEDGRWPFLQGIELERTDPDRAVACIERAIAAEPDRVLFRLRLAEMLIALGKLDEAQDPLQVARTLEPDNPRTQLAWARWEYRRGHLEQSLAHASRAAELRPDTRATHQLLARIHHRLNQPAAAARQLEVVQRLPARSIIFPDPITNELGLLRRDPGRALDHAQFLLEQQQTESAIRVLRGVVDRNPGVLAAQIELWRALLQAGKIVESEAALQAALGHHPGSPHLLLLRGIELFDAGQWGKATGWFKRSIAHQADNAAAHYHLGLCQAQQDDRSAAIGSLRAAVACEPDHARAHTALGKLLLEDKAFTAATRHLQTAVKFAPDDPQPRKLLEQARRARDQR